MQATELVKMIENLPSQLKQIQEELAEIKTLLKQKANGQDTTSTSSEPPVGIARPSRKNEVGEKTWRTKAPLFLSLILRGGNYRTLGVSMVELESKLAVSPNTIFRIAKKLVGKDVMVTKQARGSYPTMFRLKRNRDQAARALVTELGATLIGPNPERLAICPEAELSCVMSPDT